MDMARMAVAQAWQVTALALLVFAATRMVARNRPHLAYVLWLVVLIKCATPPIWSSPVGLFTIAQNRIAALWLDSESTVANPPLTIPVVLDQSSIIDQASFAEVADVSVSLNVTPESSAIREERNYLFLIGLGVVWAIGFLFSILFTTARWWRCISRLRRSPSIEDASLQRMLKDLSSQLGIKQQVKLLITTCNVGPAVIGLLKPVIVLPDAIVSRRSADDLRAILAHELIHIRRGDLWLGLLQVCTSAIWWFYPLVWMVNRLMSREVERCCDEEVVGELKCSPRDYARSLLGVLELKSSLEPIPAFPGVKPVEVTTNRLERIMSLGQGCRRRTPKLYWAIMLMLAGLALPGAALVSGQDEPLYGGVDQQKTLPTWRETDPKPITAKQYKIADIVAKAEKKYSCSTEQAEQIVANLVARLSGLDERRKGWSQRMRLIDGRLAFAGAADDHKLFQIGCERLREHGVSLLEVETRLVAAPEQLSDSTNDRWSLLLQTHESGAATRFLESSQVGSNEARTSSTTIIPTVYKTLTAEQAKASWKALVSNPKTNVLFAPRILLFDGQSGHIDQGTQRPFVVGMDRRDEGISPRIQVIKEGLSIMVRPKVEDENEVILEFKVEHSEITDVGEQKVTVVGIDKPFTVQTPTLDTSQIHSHVRMELGHTLIVRGLTPGKRNEKHSRRMMLITPRRLEAVEHPQTKVAKGMADWPFAKAGLGAEMLSKKVTAKFHDTPLIKALTHLAKSAGVPTMIIGEKVFDNEKQSRRISLNIESVELQDALHALLQPVNAEFEVKDDTLIIRAAAPRITQVYNVADLVDVELDEIAPKGFSDSQSDTTTNRRLAILLAAIRNEVRPDSWATVGGRGAIRPFAENLSLVVSNTKTAHDEIAQYLGELRLRFDLSSARQTPVRIRPVGREHRYVVVYRVANLIVPKPGVVGGQAGKSKIDAMDFGRLIELITTTIAPESWDSAGGAGAIEPYPTNLSIVVSQTSSVHQEIADLLEQLTRLQSVQVTLRTKLLRTSRMGIERMKETAARHGVSGGIVLLSSEASESASMISSSELKLLLMSAKAGQEPVQQTPTLTLFNGQTANLQMAPENGKKLSLEFQAVCSENHKSVRLRCKTSLDPSSSKSAPHTIPKGKTLILRASPTPKSDTDEQIFLMITPDIVIPEEEEALLGLEPHSEESKALQR